MKSEGRSARLFECVRKLFAVTSIVSGVTGCHEADRSGQPETAPPPTSTSQSVVMIDLQTSLDRPVILSEQGVRYLHDRVDALAAASKLTKLTGESANEVRIWETVATFGPDPGYHTVGYVITPSRISRCEIDYPPDGQPPFAGHCEVMRQPHEFDAARILEPLLPYADTDMGCGIADGVWYELDIAHRGKRFVISASNPDQCNDKGSAAVSSLLETVYQRR